MPFNYTYEVKAMEKNDVIAFFDQCAASWDAEMIRNEEVLKKILDQAGIVPGAEVLDVACGTGVLIPDYFARKAASVTGIDISPEMARRAREKFPQAEIICADVEEYAFGRQFDAVMVYNAFPHFPEPERLIARLAALVRPGGRLSIAHGMSRQKLAEHHKGRAQHVSIALPHEYELAALLAPWFDVDVVISDESMYQVAGTRKA